MTLKKYILSTLLCVVLTPSVWAQRSVTELESNMDTDMALQNDTTSKKKPKIVPNDIKAWVIDETYGNMRHVNVDTLMNMFYNDNLSEGRTGHFNSLSNLGSPRHSRIFSERGITPQFMFTEPFDQFFVTTDRFLHYDTKSPYMNVTYTNCGSKQTGDDHVKVIYTNNAGKHFNLGGIFDYMYGQGFYSNQSTSFMNASVWSSYRSERYNFHFYYQHNFMKMGENGGIIDERDITNPEAQAYKYASNDIPVYLDNTWGRQEHDVLFFNQNYNLGFYKEEMVDSNRIETFVPVTKLFHTLKLMGMRRYYKSYNETPGYHSYTYLPGDSTNDWTKYTSIRNHVGITLCEGFNKWSIFGISAYIGHEYRRFIIMDTIPGGRISGYDRRIDTQNNIFVGGQLFSEQNKYLRFNANAEFGIYGEELGAFDINGHGEMNLPLFGDTAQLAVNAYIKRITPSYYYAHYHGKHAWWDKSLDKEYRQRIEGVLSLPTTKTRLGVSLENITNYTYFANNGGWMSATDTATNNIVSLQHSGSIQVMRATLEQNFRLGILHFDNEITYQTTSNEAVLPLPKLSTYHNIYIDFRIAKVLHTQMGADLKYFTEYYAPDYSPVIGMFTTQRESNKVKIGNYPLVSVYANFALKRTRFYLHYYHANQSDGRYFWAPGYPMNPTTLRFGLSWNFFD